MILSRAFYVPSENNFYVQMKQILMSEFGLVEANQNKVSPVVGYLSSPEHPTLVWEDEQKIGRYRVRFIPKQRVITEKIYDMVCFHYWINQRLRKEVMEKDPMKSALERTLTEAGDYIVLPHLLYQREEGLEDVLGWITEEKKGEKIIEV